MLKCAFLGSKSLGLRIFQAVEPVGGAEWRILHPVDDGDPRSNFADFQSYARQRSIDLLSVANSAAAEEALQEFRPDFVLVCGWYWLINERMLATSKFYGIHNSLLPRYRGGAPLVWSIMSGDAQVGSSVFEISPGMDDGDIVFQVAVNNCPDLSIGSLLGQIEEALVEKLPTAWRSLLAGELTPQKQDHSAATYCGQRSPEDGRIDWRWPVAKINNFIRAQSAPYPGAFTSVEGKKLTIWKSEPCPEVWLGTPGQVLMREAESVLVACGDGALRILECSLDETRTAPRTAMPSVKTRLQGV